METTTNYGLKVYEGTDKFNPLTIENYNTEQIDEKMKANEDASIGTATEIKGGIVHAITRANGDIPMFRFTATSNYESGDAFTVDGVNVTALTSTGETLDDGAYVIGAEVLCCLVGTRLTVFVGQTSISHASDSDKLGNQLPSYYAQTSWIGALGDLITTAKNNLVSAINELATSIASLIANKQDKTDNTLVTADKTIVGAINSLKNDKQTRLHSLAYTGTTDDFGRLVTDIPRVNKVVCCCLTPIAGEIVEEIYSDTYLYFKVRLASTDEAIANQSRRVYIYYFDN